MTTPSRNAVIVGTADPTPGPLPSDRHQQQLRASAHAEPHAVLGAHMADEGLVVRAFHPDATACTLLLAGEELEMVPLDGGLFARLLPDLALPLEYRIRFRFANGDAWERDDPYRFAPTIGPLDLHLFGEGNHRRLWEAMGAHLMTVNGVLGTRFTVWAPNARRVSVVGHFCRWDGRIYPMRSMGSGGVWELFVPGVMEGDLYKFEIVTGDGTIIVKTDPFGRRFELPPAHAAVVVADDQHEWHDDAWMTARPTRDPHTEPMSIYEVNLGSWARVPEDGDRSLSYREIAPRLAEHARGLGFTHVELMPVAEFPFGGSWGYQVSGYFAPTSRYGTPDDFRHFVDVLHQAGLGVIVDWVPAHFPKDAWALRRFDGTALFEHEDPRLGDHPDWGTHIFNYGRNEVRNFLVANALYWLREFHVDALRVDAVASMLYLDYSRKAGEWLRNREGGRENLDAVAFLRLMNDVVREDAPGCFTVAEESTAWPGVTSSSAEGGLGFTFKWNMGWMNDTLRFFERDPLWRGHHLGELSFAMVYEYSERFIMPLSHDEVVHLKHSMLEKMPGDEWQKFANLRLLYAYMYTRPGKQLLFMGSEIAQRREWNHDVSIDWHLREQPLHARMESFLAELGALYHEMPAFWKLDYDPRGFAWIDCADRENAVAAYVRRDGERHAVVALNFTPIPRERYRFGVPGTGAYRVRLSSDDPRFGGSGFPMEMRVPVDNAPFHGFEHSIEIALPPLAAVVLEEEAG